MSLPRSTRSHSEAPAAPVTVNEPTPLSLSTSSSSTSTSQPLKPDPSNTIPFTWSCKCTNVILNGRIRKELQDAISTPKSGSPSSGGPLTSAWIDRTGEQCKMHEYMIFEGPGETRGRERMPSGETEGTWRRCLMCNVKVYKVPGLHTRDDHSTRGLWVEIDLNDSIYYGPSLDELLKQPALPFSKLRFPVPSTSTNFRRLPGAQAVQFYEPNPFTKSTLAHTTLLPERRDVFMGPPRPKPPHPYLHGLCVEAERYTADRHHEIHGAMMAEIYASIAKSTEKYLKIEEAVRSELEVLYDTFLETNPDAKEASSSKRRGSLAGKAKSRSPSKEPVQRNFSPPPRDHPSIHAVISSAVPTLKLKNSWNEDTSDLPEAKDNDQPAKPHFASSLLTSSLLANRPRAPTLPQAPPSVPEESIDEQLNETLQLDKTKDQRATAMSYVFSELDEQIAKAERKDAMQRAIEKAELEEKERRLADEAEKAKSPAATSSVTFVEPENQESSSSEEADDSPPPRPRATEAEDEDEVFDFEMEDEQAGPSTASTTSLAKTDEYAGHAPSHRNAWKDKGDGRYSWNENKDIYDSRRRNPRDDDDDKNDFKRISALAQSMPLDIVRQPLRAISGYVPADLEPKTSLSEREGYFVPPLKTAMKKSVRIESPVSGPSENDKEDVQPGVTGRKGFVPPHIQVREEDKALMKASGGSRSIYDK